VGQGVSVGASVNVGQGVMVGGSVALGVLVGVAVALAVQVAVGVGESVAVAQAMGVPKVGCGGGSSLPPMLHAVNTLTTIAANVTIRRAIMCSLVPRVAAMSFPCFRRPSL